MKSIEALNSQLDAILIAKPDTKELIATINREDSKLFWKQAPEVLYGFLAIWEPLGSWVYGRVIGSTRVVVKFDYTISR